MFNFIHRRTCKHKDVHQLPKPESLTILASRKSAWTNGGIRILRLIRLDRAVEQELKESSVPTPGLKDAITGWPSLVVNPLSGWTPGPTTSEIPTPDCSKSGEDTDTDMNG